MKKEPIICTGGETTAFAILDGEPLCVDCLYKAVKKSGKRDLLAKITPLHQVEEESESVINRSATG